MVLLLENHNIFAFTHINSYTVAPYMNGFLQEKNTDILLQPLKACASHNNTPCPTYHVIIYQWLKQYPLNLALPHLPCDYISVIMCCMIKRPHTKNGWKHCNLLSKLFHTLFLLCVIHVHKLPWLINETSTYSNSC